MTRVEEKVKDIIEVRPFSILYDFAADPGKTLAGYHFTDITSDLMAKWLDAVTNVKKGQGAAIALAGFRGVGKSHFLSVLAAIVSSHELRDGIADQHVASRADRLSRRHSPVAFVQRGSQETLIDELKFALASVINCKPDELSDSIDDLLLKTSQHVGETPLVLLIDTALGRHARVSRDDGAALSEIAEAAKLLGIFVGLALDDDIAGADGANSSISDSFSIDYLDQEHLYKVVDSHVFKKKDRALPVLHEIYKYYSTVLPGFRWSEQRFTSLYPLHPATLEIAPLFRLYLQDFALLGFASEAGVRIMARPANSLIGLDEIFDAVEKKMREVAELADAFRAFDDLNRDIVAKTPVRMRLPSKLILKGLFMLSLDGQGSTATNLAASMLIFNESESISPPVDIAGILESFSTAMPEAVSRSDGDLAEPKYCFTVGNKDEINTLLDEKALDVPIDAVRLILLRHMSEKFSDLVHPVDTIPVWTNCSVEWRGSIRHGEIYWGLGDGGDQAVSAPATNDFTDWSVSVTFGTPETKSDHAVRPDNPVVEWHLADLRTEEIIALQRAIVLQSDVKLREEFGHRFSAANQIQALAVEKIWKRVFLADSRLVFGDREFDFTDEAMTAHTLSHLFTIMLEPVFDSKYPAHPEFLFPLGVKEAAKLTGQFFGGAAPGSGDVQKLAELFAMPLGLVELRDDVYIAVSADAVADIPIIRSTFEAVEASSESVITINELSERMLASPFGLTREAQHLVLAALVAGRQFEFVTFNGNRINHRSLDLQIIWDDIAGIARPFTEAYSGSRLSEWAVLLTGKSEIKSLETSDDRLMIIDALSEWLADWKGSNVLEMFESLPDENLNSSIWRIAANLRKTFGAVAECIDALIQNSEPLDQCIHDIADVFSDSESEFETKKADLDVLRNFTLGAARRDEIATYLALCEITADRGIEQLRRGLLDLTGAGYFAAGPKERDETEALWNEFKTSFSVYYVEKHDAIMRSTEAGEKLREILKSNRWAIFESFSDLEWFDKNCVAGADASIRKIGQMNCKANVAELLESRPFCSCSFRLGRFDRRQDQPNRLEIIIDQGLSRFQTRLIENAAKVSESVAAVAGGTGKPVAASIRKRLSDSIDADGLINLSAPEIRLLRSAIEDPRHLPLNSDASDPAARDDFSDLLPNELRDWENEIDRLEIFAKPKP